MLQQTPEPPSPPPAVATVEVRGDSAKEDKSPRTPFSPKVARTPDSKSGRTAADWKDKPPTEGNGSDDDWDDWSSSSPVKATAAQQSSASGSGNSGGSSAAPPTARAVARAQQFEALTAEAAAELRAYLLDFADPAATSELNGEGEAGAHGKRKRSGVWFTLRGLCAIC